MIPGGKEGAKQGSESGGIKIEVCKEGAKQGSESGGS